MGNRRTIPQAPKEAKAKGIVIFRDDRNMEFILDMIDNYMDLVDAVTEY